MNLRKDHSHTSKRFIRNHWCELLGGWKHPHRHSWGGRAWLVLLHPSRSSAILRIAHSRPCMDSCTSSLCFHELLPQFSVTDVSARTTMKGAAKCDKHFELQNSVSQQGLERSLRFRDIPGSMPASVSTVYYPSSVDPFYGKGLVAACHCASACLPPLTWPVHGSSFWSAGC